MITHLDHIYSYLNGNNLDGTLARFEKAGFLISPNKMRHAEGMLTGFVSFTGTYLEFISIVDEAEFAKEASEESKLLRLAPHPYGIGAVCLDPDLIYNKLSPIYPQFKPPYSTGSADKPEDIIWTFSPFPSAASLGAYLFALKYHKRLTPEFEEKKGPNSIFGIAGVYFCADDPEARADLWEKTLQSVTQDFKRANSEISFGCQKLRWMGCPERERIFGDQGWDQRKFLGAEICGVRLLAESLTAARRHLEQGGFQVRHSPDLNALITTDPNSAFTLVIEEGVSAQFCSALNRMTYGQGTLRHLLSRLWPT